MSLHRNIILAALIILMSGVAVWYFQSDVKHVAYVKLASDTIPDEATSSSTQVSTTQSSSDPIATVLKSCEDSNPSTAGVTDCIKTATTQYQANMDASYAYLVLKLPEAQKQALADAQSAWIAYKDKEMLWLRQFYNAMKGTMFIPIYANDVMVIWKVRAEALGHYVGVLNI